MIDSKSDFSALWVEGPIGPYEKLSLETFLRSGSAVSVYTYGDGTGIPAGVNIVDARSIVPESRLRTFPGGVTHFSNLFRYSLLCARPTIWFDADMLLLRPEAIPDQSHLYGKQDDHLINTAILSLPPDSPALIELAARADVLPEAKLRWGMLGPQLLTDVLSSHGLEGHALRREFLYPVSPREIWRIYEPSHRWHCETKTGEAITIHLWNQYLKKNQLKPHAPAPGSYLDGLAQTFDFDFGLPPLKPGEAESRAGRSRRSRATGWRRVLSPLGRVLRMRKLMQDGRTPDATA